jgi:hypothetical protein
MKQLLQIQAELKAPKNQFNAFGKYKYRNAEDILEAVKPLLLKYNCELTLSDDIRETSSGLIYVNCTAILRYGEEDSTMVQAQAGIDVNRKGMDIAQSFGSSSSYARKYALSGLFLLDDTKDADATNTHGKEAPTRAEKDKLIRETEKLPEERRAKAVVAINKAETHDEFIKLKTALEQIKP